MIRLCVTEYFIKVKIYRLILFTYVAPINRIGYLIHRTDDKQMYGYAWNPYDGKIYTLKDGN